VAFAADMTDRVLHKNAAFFTPVSNKFNGIFIFRKDHIPYICSMYRLTSYLSLVFGVLAALSIFKATFLMFGLVFCLLGFAASIINIFIQTKYQLQIEKWTLTKAHLGLVLSSVPVIYIIIIVVIYKN
jgi:hypothetical protein